MADRPAPPPFGDDPTRERRPRHLRIDDRPAVRDLDQTQLAAEAVAALRAERRTPPGEAGPDILPWDDAPTPPANDLPASAGRHRAGIPGVQLPSEGGAGGGARSAGETPPFAGILATDNAPATARAQAGAKTPPPGHAVAGGGARSAVEIPTPGATLAAGEQPRKGGASASAGSRAPGDPETAGVVPTPSPSWAPGAGPAASATPSAPARGVPAVRRWWRSRVTLVLAALLVVAGIGSTVLVAGSSDGDAGPPATGPAGSVGPTATIPASTTAPPVPTAASGTAPVPAAAADGPSAPLSGPGVAGGNDTSPAAATAPDPARTAPPVRTTPAPAVLSTLAPGDDGFGWPTTAFGRRN